MMKCCYFFMVKAKSKGELQSAPSSTTILTPISNNGNRRSQSCDSTSAKQTSKSSCSTSSPRSIPAMYEEKAHNLQIFELKELRNATNDFSKLLKIGEGGFGSVYKGAIKPSNGQGERVAVAIKTLNQNGLQGHKQWLAEVQFLSVVEHPNLVKLIGYCAVDGERGIQRLLVYEFVPNKTLDDHLFNRAYSALPWDLRLRIALGAAQGLAYLHEGLEVQVIYRDFKASNVLLDEEFKPKLSDFGLAREGPSDGNTHVSTAVVGTHGYAAPDYIETGHLTIKSDVWSFGVVLYEILTGRRSLERNRPRNEQKLLDWVKQFPVESRKFGMIMDHRFGNHYSLAGAQVIGKLANNCLSKSSKDRPNMSEVVERLKHAIHVTETGGHPAEELSATSHSETQQPDNVSGSESLRRRMLHLSRLRESANVETNRRFRTMHRSHNQA